MKEVVAKILKKALKEKDVSMTKEEIMNIIEIPPTSDLGDYAFPCFSLSKELKDNPSQIAIEIREKIGNAPATDFEDVQTKGPYINFFVNRKSLARQVVWDAIMKKKDYGRTVSKTKKRTMVEFCSPNTNKPLHLGHLRNMALGESVSRILEFSDEKIIRANLNNDRGVHICKSMLAYKKWGKDKTPDDKKLKPDHFVGHFYTLFNKKKTKKLEKEAQEMLMKWESGDKETLMLWKLLNGWSLKGFKQTYETFGTKFDTEFFESKIYNKGRKLILDGVKNGLFEKTKKGEVKINLEEEGLGEKILLRNDGTALYITQDLALAKEKFERYDLDRSIYITGNEQNYHFNVLFSLLRKLGFSEEVGHLSYGLVNLPSGRMKSREGKIVDADDLIERVRLIAEKELLKREKLPKSELRKRSLVIALSAIKYMLLKIDLKKDMLFNPKESVSFDGNTGPYILYSYARASSIMKKAPKEKKFEVPELTEKEIELVKKLSYFPEVASNSAKNLNPSLVANYSYQLAQLFNEFYHDSKVIGSDEESFRLALVQAFRQTLRNALDLLGIETLEEM